MLSRLMGAAKDTQSFKLAEAGDINLGINDVRDKYKKMCEIVSNY